LGQGIDHTGNFVQNLLFSVIMQQPHVQFPQGFIESFCERHHIKKLSLFGSVLRSDFRPDSDVDVLAEFYPGKTPSLFDMVDLELELAMVLGRKVDLRTPSDIGRFMRPRILGEAVLQYAARG
jgi:predicted nucleotidyltransferase